MANTTIRLKKSGVVSNVPASLELGELALNYADGKLYYKNADGLITYISSGASTNSFATINANSSLIIATSNTDILSLAAANNITITADGIGKTITIGSLLTDALYVNSSSIGASANAVYTVYTLAQATRDGLNYTSNVAADAYTFAGNAYNKANSAAITAQAAFDKANSGGAFVNVDYLTIEKQLYTANASQTNFFAHYTPPFVTVVINGATIDSSEYSTATANTIILNNPASAGDIVDITAFTTFNSNTFIGGIGSDPWARDAANSAVANTIVTQGVDAWQNTQITAVNGYATGAYALSNTNASNITSVNGYAAGAYGLANTNATNITAVNQYAQSAYATANTKFNSSGGNITGSVTISGNNDLTVSGNLYITGTTFYSNTQSFVTNDPMLYLGIGNYTSDITDIGFAAHYNDGSNAHTGLIRDSGTKEYYFFKGYTPELDANNNIDINDASFSKANVNADYLKGNLISTTGVFTGALDSTSNTTGTVKITGGVGVTGNVYADKIYVNGLFWAANGNVISTGGGTSSTNQFNIYKYIATYGQTVFSGPDSASVSLNYTVGAIIVTLNGLTLKPGTDYTATDGSSITLAVAADTSDELNIYGFTSTTVNTSNTLSVFSYSASAGQTSFGGVDQNGNSLGYVPGNLFTTYNGITLRNGVDYTAANGSYINLTFSAAANDEIVVYTFGAFNVANTYTKAEANNIFAVASNTYTKTEVNTLIASSSTAGKTLAINFFRS